MSSNTKTRIEETRERIAAFATRARQSEASARAKLVEAYQADEAELDAYCLEVQNELDAMAAEIERADAQLVADLRANLREADEDIEATLDAVDARVDRLDEAVAAREDAATGRARATVAKLRSLPARARRELEADFA